MNPLSSSSQQTQNPLSQKLLKQAFEIPLSSHITQVLLLVHPEEPAWPVQIRFNRISRSWILFVQNPISNLSLSTPIFSQQIVFGSLGRSYLQIDWDWVYFFSPTSLTSNPSNPLRNSLMLVMQ